MKVGSAPDVLDLDELELDDAGAAPAREADAPEREAEAALPVAAADEPEDRAVDEPEAEVCRLWEQSLMGAYRKAGVREHS